MWVHVSLACSLFNGKYSGRIRPPPPPGGGGGEKKTPPEIWGKGGKKKFLAKKKICSNFTFTSFFPSRLVKGGIISCFQVFGMPENQKFSGASPLDPIGGLTAPPKPPAVLLTRFARSFRLASLGSLPTLDFKMSRKRGKK